MGAALGASKGRPPGLPKTGGRRPGTGNKKTSFRTRIARTTTVLEAYQKNPIEEMLKLIPKLEPVEQLKAWQYIHQYVDMKPKEMPEEERVLDDALEDVPTEQLLELAKREQQ